MTPRKSPKAPPFCPNPDCRFHCGDTTSWPCTRNGTFSAGRSGRSTQRYICHECGRSFSDRTFRSTYWLKRPDLFLRVARGLVSCSGYRQLAAGLAGSPQTVARHASRLGKQSLLFHERMRKRKPVEEPVYPRAIRRSGLNIPLFTISSRAERTPWNPLFAVNLHDLQIRHGSSNHKRETISFSKLLSAAIERMWLHLVWKNYVKPFSEKKGGATPAQRAGFTGRKWTFRQVFRRRLFPDRVGLPGRWWEHWLGTRPTRAYGSTEKHSPRFAY